MLAAVVQIRARYSPKADTYAAGRRRRYSVVDRKIAFCELRVYGVLGSSAFTTSRRSAATSSAPAGAVCSQLVRKPLSYRAGAPLSLPAHLWSSQATVEALR